MATIFCSPKLSDQLELKQVMKPSDNTWEEGYGNWIAELFLFLGNKCIIFVNEKSLYSFVLMDVKSNDFKESGLLISAFLNQLQADNIFKSDEFDFWADYFSNLKISKFENDPKVIDSIRFMILQLKGGLDNGLLPFKNRTYNAIATNLNILPNGLLDFQTPLEAFSEI